MLNVVKIAVVLAMLIMFAAIGIGCAVNADWGIRHFSRTLMGGGELRKEWNRTQVSVFGLIFAGFALWMIYALIFK